MSTGRPITPQTPLTTMYYVAVEGGNPLTDLYEDREALETLHGTESAGKPVLAVKVQILHDTTTRAGTV